MATSENYKVKRIYASIPLASLMYVMINHHRIKLIRRTGRWGNEQFETLYEGRMGKLDEAFPKDGITLERLKHSEVCGIRAGISYTTEEFEMVITIQL